MVISTGSYKGRLREVVINSNYKDFKVNLPSLHSVLQKSKVSQLQNDSLQMSTLKLKIKDSKYIGKNLGPRFLGMTMVEAPKTALESFEKVIPLPLLMLVFLVIQMQWQIKLPL